MSREADWVRIAELYADSTLPLAEISRLTGVPVGTISARAVRDGWPRRSRGRIDARRIKANWRALLMRLLRAVERQIGEIETRLDTPEWRGRPAAELAQDARMIESLARTLEKVRALQRAEAADAAARAQGDGGDDAGTLRDELERRLAGLFASVGETGVSEKPE